MSGDVRLLEQARVAYIDGRHLDARLLVAAALAQVARSAGIKAALVGGSAVDFYAARATPAGLEPSPRLRASLDVDIVAFSAYGDHIRLRRLLDRHPSYAKADALDVDHARKWVPTGLPVLLEILGDELHGDKGRVVEVDIGEGTAYLWGPEDTFWQYAENAWSQRSRSDWERAVVVAAVQDLDWAYLDGVVRKEGKPRAILLAAQTQASFEEMVRAAFVAKAPDRPSPA